VAAATSVLLRSSILAIPAKEKTPYTSAKRTAADFCDVESIRTFVDQSPTYADLCSKLGYGGRNRYGRIRWAQLHQYAVCSACDRNTEDV